MVLVEDNHQHAEWLRSCIGEVPGLVLAHWVVSIEAALHLLQGWRAKPPALILLDINLGHGNGLTLLPMLRRRWPDTHVMVVSQRSDERNFVQAMRGGARGYLVKDGGSATVVSALHAVRRGQFLISPDVARHLLVLGGALEDEDGVHVAAEATREPGEPALRLTDRERQVLRCLSEGQSYADTALALAISQSTVQTHIRNLYRKLDATSKVTALVRARVLGLLGRD